MIETRENSCLAQELVAGFISDFFREGAVVFDFFQRALAALETGVIGKINGSHSALTDPFTDLITAAQYLPVLEGWKQLFSFYDYLSMAIFRQIYFGVSSAQKRIFMLYYYNLLLLTSLSYSSPRDFHEKKTG